MNMIRHETPCMNFAVVRFCQILQKVDIENIIIF